MPTPWLIFVQPGEYVAETAALSHDCSERSGPAAPCPPSFCLRHHRLSTDPSARSTRPVRSLDNGQVRALSVISDASEETSGTPALPASPPAQYPADFAPPSMTHNRMKLL